LIPINVVACHPDIPLNSPIGVLGVKMTVSLTEQPPIGSPSTYGRELGTPASLCDGGGTFTIISGSPPEHPLALGQWQLTLTAKVTVDTGLYAGTQYKDGRLYTGTTFSISADNNPLTFYVLPSDSKHIQLTVTSPTGKEIPVVGVGDMTIQSVENLGITTTNGYYKLDFTVSGPTGSTGSEVVSMPANAVPPGYTPVVYVNGQKAAQQYYTSDSPGSLICAPDCGFHIYFQVHFSTAQVEIQFVPTSPAPAPGQILALGSLTPLVLLLAFPLAMAGVGLGILSARSGKRPTQFGQRWAERQGAASFGGGYPAMSAEQPQPMPSMRVCRYCGHQISSEGAFCGFCGRKLT
jgi:hypothetical protein